MATHVRRQIREAVETVLDGLPSGPNVVKPRGHAVARARLPAVRVVAREEAAEPDAMGDGGTLARRLTLTVEGLAEGGDDLENVLDGLASEVETAVGADPTFGGLVEDSWLASTEIAVGEPGERRTGAIELGFAVLYRTARGAPTVAL